MGELNPQKKTNLRGDTRLFTKQEKNIEMREDYVFPLLYLYADTTPTRYVFRNFVSQEYYDHKQRLGL